MKIDCWIQQQQQKTGEILFSFWIIQSCISVVYFIWVSDDQPPIFADHVIPLFLMLFIIYGNRDVKFNLKWASSMHFIGAF